MKKKVWRIVIPIILLLAILFIPLPSGQYEDGGTRVYSALAYKIVDWNRILGEGIYDETKVYWFPENFKSVDSLWYCEEENVVSKVVATVLELDETSALVEPVAGEDALHSSDRIRIGITDLKTIGAEVGSLVEISYTGGIMETYPAQLKVLSWQIAKDLRHMEYTAQWLDKESAEKYDHNIFSDIVITEIYSNCFFATYVTPSLMQIKLNGTLSEDWCVGDQVYVTYENTWYDAENYKIEVDMLTVEQSTFQLDPNMCYKPVIYLYPEEEMQVSVKINPQVALTCTYPAYGDGWTVTASPDGTLTDANGQQYNYLYWEGQTFAQWDMSKGFCVKGGDTAAFLEDALQKLGLGRREANEFIVYWLPLMQENPYNIISFQTDAYTAAAGLEISPAPDTLLRVFMTWQAADAPVEIQPQDLTAPEREGFTVVEWGGTEISVQ